MVEKPTVNRAVDQGALEAEFAHGAREFVGRRRGGHHRQMGEAGETLRLSADQRRETVAAGARHSDSLRAGDQFRSGTGRGEDLRRHARRVHGGDPPRAEIGERRRHDRAKTRRSRRRPAVSDERLRFDPRQEIGKDEMLFDADNAQGGCPIERKAPRGAPAAARSAAKIRSPVHGGRRSRRSISLRATPHRHAGGQSPTLGSRVGGARSTLNHLFASRAQPTETGREGTGGFGQTKSRVLAIAPARRQGSPRPEAEVLGSWFNDHRLDAPA